MVRNIIFDFGGVLIDWNPRHLYDRYFHGDVEQSQWFIDNICTMEWNVQMDAGKPFAEGTAELVAQHPEWRDAIVAYRERWGEMIGGPIPDMLELIKKLKAAGYHVFGLSNWNWDTLSTIKDDYPFFDELEGMVISGLEYVIKPQPEIYQLLLDRYQLRADECLFIDDNLTNIRGGEAVGIKGLQFSGISKLEQDLQKLGILKG